MLYLTRSLVLAVVVGPAGTNIPPGGYPVSTISIDLPYVVSLVSIAASVAVSWGVVRTQMAQFKTELAEMKASSVTREVLDLRLLNMDTKLDNMQKSIDKIADNLTSPQHPQGG